MSIGSDAIASGALGASSSASYSIQVVSATFTLSMQGAGKLITAVYTSGQFILDGRHVGLTAQRPANFDAGTFTLTGQDVTLDQNFGLIIDAIYNNAAFTYSGQDIVFEKGFGMVLTSEPFSLTGLSVDFTKQMNISAETGSFALTGQDALKGVSEAFDVGAFTYTGQSVELFAGRFLRPQTQNYVITMEQFKIRGWLTPSVSVKTWTDVTPVPPQIWTDAA